MEKTIIIKLHDSENIEYPFIEIKAEGLNIFEKQLKLYQKDGSYNIDDFILIIERYDFFIRVINPDKDFYF